MCHRDDQRLIQWLSMTCTRRSIRHCLRSDWKIAKALVLSYLIAAKWSKSQKSQEVIEARLSRQIPLKSSKRSSKESLRGKSTLKSKLNNSFTSCSIISIRKATLALKLQLACSQWCWSSIIRAPSVSHSSVCLIRAQAVVLKVEQDRTKTSKPQRDKLN